MMQTKDIIKDWLFGTTCHTYYCKREVLFENDAYIILKHGSHASYMDRMNGSRNCGAYAALYDKAAFEPSDRYPSNAMQTGYGELREWRGRINKKQILADCAMMGIQLEEVKKVD